MVFVEFLCCTKLSCRWLPFGSIEGYRTWNDALKDCRKCVLEEEKSRMFRLTADVNGKAWVKYYRVAYEVKACAYYIDINKMFKDVTEICNEFSEFIKGVKLDATS